jgi:hypothetical protein
MEARKHPRLSELIRAGTLITRGRAYAYAIGSPGLESGCSVRYSEEGSWASEGATVTAAVNGSADGSARVGLGLNWG